MQETRGTAVNPVLTGLGVDQRFARNDTGGRTYFLTDHLGSTRALTNASGAVVQRYDYTAYGEVTQSASGFSNPYQYTGREQDASGLMYYRARYYSPEQARFVSEDSYGFGGGDANFYAYVGGDPLSATDPSGHHPVLLALLWAVRIAQVGLIINAGYQAGRLLLDQCATRSDKAMAVASLIASAAGGFVLGKVAGKIVNALFSRKLAKLHDVLEGLVEKHLLPKFRKIDPDLVAGFTGSFKTGVVGNPLKSTFGQRVNLDDLDIDYWIESDILFSKHGKKLSADEAFRKVLSETPGFEGLRPGKKGFSIKFKESSKGEG